MSVETDPALPRGVSVRLTATLSDGTTVTRQVDDPRGSLGNPLSDRELEDKFTMLASPVLPDGAAEKLAAAIWSAEKLDNASELLSLATPREGTGHAA
jgi:2-methylcitrate dehydratase PrpD